MGMPQTVKTELMNYSGAATFGAASPVQCVHAPRSHGSKSCACRYVVGLLNRSKGKMALYPAMMGTLMPSFEREYIETTLAPSLTSSHAAVLNEKEAGSSTRTEVKPVYLFSRRVETAMLQQRKDLIDKFGSKVLKKGFDLSASKQCGGI